MGVKDQQVIAKELAVHNVYQQITDISDLAIKISIVSEEITKNTVNTTVASQSTLVQTEIITLDTKDILAKLSSLSSLVLACNNR